MGDAAWAEENSGAIKPIDSRSQPETVFDNAFAIQQRAHICTFDAKIRACARLHKEMMLGNKVSAQQLIAELSAARAALQAMYGDAREYYDRKLIQASLVTGPALP